VNGYFGHAAAGPHMYVAMGEEKNNINSPSFGNITVALSPRIVQFAAKFVF
jgi:hypothetical protein